MLRIKFCYLIRIASKNFILLEKLFRRKNFSLMMNRNEQKNMLLGYKKDLQEESKLENQQPIKS